MSVVLRIGKVKFKINAKDHNPPHVHVEGYGESVRINLSDFEQMNDTNFSPSALRMIREAVEMHREELLSKWKEYHGEEEI